MNEDIFNFNSTIEPELEARIIALVLGEASDFETEELNRLIALRPELAAFKRQMEEVNGLMAEVSAGEFEAPGDDWKLPADRRNLVLATIRGEASVQPTVQSTVQTVVPSVPIRTPWRRRWQRSLTQVLATACFAGAIASYTFYFQSKERADSQAVPLAKSDADVFWDKSIRFTYGRDQQPTSESRPSVLLSTAPSSSRGRHVIPSEEQRGSQLAKSDGEFQENSQQALSALSGTLNEGTTKLFLADNQNGESNAGGAPGALQDSGLQSNFQSDSVSSLIVGNADDGNGIMKNSDDGIAVTGPEPVTAAPGVESFIAKNDTDWMAKGFGLGSSDESVVPRAPNAGDDFGTRFDINVNGNGNGVVDFVEKSDPAAAVHQEALVADGKPTVPLFVVPPTEGRSSGGFGNDKSPAQPGIAKGFEGQAAYDNSSRFEMGKPLSPLSGKQLEVPKSEPESLGLESSKAAATTATADPGNIEAMPTDGLSIAGRAIAVPEADVKVRLSRTTIDASQPESPAAAFQKDRMDAHSLDDAIDSPFDPPASAKNEPTSAGVEFTVPEQVQEAGEAVRGDTTMERPVNESLDRLQGLQRQPGEQSSTWKAKREGGDSREEAGREQSEYETNIPLDVSGKADNSTDAKWSNSPDDSRRFRDVIVDEESQLGGRGLGGRRLESRGGNASGDQAHPFGERYLDMPAEAKPVDTVTGQSGSDNSLKALAGRELQESIESPQSESKESWFARPGAGQPAGGGQSANSDDPAINLRGEVDVQAMQDLGVLILKGNEADVAKVEETTRAIEAEQVQSLGQTESVKPGAATHGDSAGKGESNGRVKDGPLDGNASGYAIDTSGARSDIDSALPQKSSGLEAKDSKKSDAVTESARGFGFRQNAGGKTDGLSFGRPLQLYDNSDNLQSLAEARSKTAAERTVAPSVSMNETTAVAEAFSTFSLHVSDVSFKLAAAALARGEWPEAAKIRIEEFVNAFDYGDPLPCNGEKVACVVEQSIHPFLQQRNMLRVSMRTGAEGRASSTPLRLTFLLDNSGSMERADRQDTVRRAFALLSQQLTPIDQVTLISFARQPRLLAEKVSGAEAGQLVKLIDELPSEGGTNIEAALQLAFEKATQQQTSGAQNRIILLTDGAVNLGDADPESLSRMVTMMRDSGVAFDAAGISAEGLNDEVLEALTRKGDGRYYLLDSFEDAQESFVQQIAGALRPSASNVKVQIEFNPKRVGHYKLLGFEKHVLKQEDFHNDAVDAAEMAAAEAGVAMYQFEAKPDGEGDVGSVSVRFRDLSTGQMVENRWPIPYEPDAPRPDQATPSLRIATSAALLAAKLRGEPLGEAVDLGTLSDLVSGLPIQEQNNTRVQQLKQMIEQARQVSGK